MPFETPQTGSATLPEMPRSGPPAAPSPAAAPLPAAAAVPSATAPAEAAAAPARPASGHRRLAELRPAPEVIRSWRAGVEWDRKGIHLGSTVLAFWAFWMPEPTATLGLAAATLAVVAVDLARLGSRRWAIRLYRSLPLVFRREERRRLSGASIMMLGVTATSLVFPAGPTTAGILCLAWGDTAAALVGQSHEQWRRQRQLRDGRRRTPAAVRVRGRKTWAGTSACLLVSMAMVAVAMGPDPQVVLLGGLAATLMERWTPGRWDNLTMPLATAGMVLWTATWLH